MGRSGVITSSDPIVILVAPVPLCPQCTNARYRVPGEDSMFLHFFEYAGDREINLPVAPEGGPFLRSRVADTFLEFRAGFA